MERYDQSSLAQRASVVRTHLSALHLLAVSQLFLQAEVISTKLFLVFDSAGLSLANITFLQDLLAHIAKPTTQLHL